MPHSPTRDPSGLYFDRSFGSFTEIIREGVDFDEYDRPPPPDSDSGAEYSEASSDNSYLSLDSMSEYFDIPRLRLTVTYTRYNLPVNLHFIARFIRNALSHSIDYVFCVVTQTPTLSLRYTFYISGPHTLLRPLLIPFGRDLPLMGTTHPRDLFHPVIYDTTLHYQFHNRRYTILPPPVRGHSQTLYG